MSFPVSPENFRPVVILKPKDGSYRSIAECRRLRDSLRDLGFRVSVIPIDVPICCPDCGSDRTAMSDTRSVYRCFSCGNAWKIVDMVSVQVDTRSAPDVSFSPNGTAMTLTGFDVAPYRGKPDENPTNRGGYGPGSAPCLCGHGKAPGTGQDRSSVR